MKVVFIGDVRVGKTAMLRSYGGETGLKPYKPTEIEAFAATYSGKEGEPSKTINITDVTGKTDLKPMRMLTLMDTDCIVICFALNDDTTLVRACSEWIDEAKKFAPKDTPLLLVGCKSDLRDIAECKGELKGIV